MPGVRFPTLPKLRSLSEQDIALGYLEIYFVFREDGYESIYDRTPAEA